MGVKIGHNVDPRDFFAPGWGDIVCEVPDGKVGELSISYTLIGEVTDRAAFEYGSVSIPLTEALDTWNAPLENVFPTESGVKQEEVKQEVFKADQIVICNHKIGTPRNQLRVRQYKGIRARRSQCERKGIPQFKR